MKKKLYLLLIFIITTTTLFSQEQISLDINQHTFSLFEEEYDEYDSKGRTVTFNREERDKTLTPLFSLILEDATGGCNDKSIEKGAYEINGTIITLYTLWTRQGSIDDAPFGGRIERYEVLKNGEVNRLSSNLYVETHTEGFDSESGMKFLFEEPKTEGEKRLFSSYIALVEKRFHGKFVFDKEADRVMKEVRKALKRRMKQLWQRR